MCGGKQYSPMFPSLHDAHGLGLGELNGGVEGKNIYYETQISVVTSAGHSVKESLHF